MLTSETIDNPEEARQRFPPILWAKTYSTDRLSRNFRNAQHLRLRRLAKFLAKPGGDFGMKGVLEVGVDGRSYGSTLVRGNQIPTIGANLAGIFPALL